MQDRSARGAVRVGEKYIDEAANCLLARVKRACALRDWGLRLAQTKGPKRARVAVARKLAVLLHRLWRSETDFRSA